MTKRPRNPGPGRIVCVVALGFIGVLGACANTHDGNGDTLRFVHIPGEGPRDHGFLVADREVSVDEMNQYRRVIGASVEPGEPDSPADFVSYDEAASYCEWRGFALPTVNHWLRMAGLQETLPKSGDRTLADWIRHAHAKAPFPYTTRGHRNGIYEWCREGNLADATVTPLGASFNPNGSVPYFALPRTGVRPIIELRGRVMSPVR